MPEVVGVLVSPVTETALVLAKGAAEAHVTIVSTRAETRILGFNADDSDVSGSALLRTSVIDRGRKRRSCRHDRHGGWLLDGGLRRRHHRYGDAGFFCSTWALLFMSRSSGWGERATVAGLEPGLFATTW
jgi:hypothetical protein